MTDITGNIRAALADKANHQTQTAKRWIWVNFQKEGIHCYPAAANEPALADVSFLGYPHRHMFHFNVQIQVTHNDRDIEFILFKRWCESLYADGTLDLNSKSCEMIADDLFHEIALAYPNRDVIIKVSEDLENGCTIEYIK